MKKVLLIIFYFLTTTLTFGQSKVDSLLNLSVKNTEKQQIEPLLKLSFELRSDTAISNLYCKKAYQLAKKYKIPSAQAQALYYLGENNFNSFDYVGALSYYEKALPIYKSLNDSLNITNCYKALGLCDHSLYKSESAIAQFIEGMKYCVNDQENTAKLISNIAKTHVRMNNLNAAIINYRKALQINTLIKNNYGIAANYNGLGEIYRTMHRMDSAIYNYSNAYQIFQKIDRKDNMAIALTNIAGVYLSFPDRWDEAEDYYNQAWKVFEEIGWDQYEAEIRQGIGIAKYNRRDYKQAINNYLLSTKINDKFNRGPEIKTTNYNLLSRAYEKMGDYKTALSYNKLYIQSSDSIEQKEKYDKLINLEKQYETEKKEKELIQLQAKQEITSFQLANNKKLKTLALITAILLFIFILFILQKYYDKIKSNELLEKKNQQIEKSENELRLLNASKNKFFSIIAHDLKNPLHAIIGYSELLNKNYKVYSDLDRQTFAKNINKSTNSLYRLLQNLLEWSKTQTGNLKFRPIECEIIKVIENPLSVVSQMAESKNISIKIDSEENLRIFADPHMIETVIRNLLSNAIKFTNENGQVEIIIQQTGKQIQFNVKDSGVGISEEEVENLFRIDSKVRRKGTNNEEGSGLGLLLCKEFVELNNGTISVISEPGKGSNFIFTIPAAPKEKVKEKDQLIEQASA